jgi:hypothetical protein
MRNPHLTIRVGRVAQGMALLVGSALLLANTSTPAFTVHDKPYYADPAVVAFVRPGLVFKIVSAQIAADGAIPRQVQIERPRRAAAGSERRYLAARRACVS